MKLLKLAIATEMPLVIVETEVAIVLITAVAIKLNPVLTLSTKLLTPLLILLTNVTPASQMSPTILTRVLPLRAEMRFQIPMRTVLDAIYVS